MNIVEGRLRGGGCNECLRAHGSGSERLTWGVLGQFPSQLCEHQAWWCVARVSSQMHHLAVVASITWDCSQSPSHFGLRFSRPALLPFRSVLTSRLATLFVNIPPSAHISDALEQKKMAPLFFEAVFLFVTMGNRTEVECVFGTQTESWEAAREAR